MSDSSNGAGSCSRGSKPQDYPSILILETPNIEDIARAIWQRQRDALHPNAIAHDVGWRDQSIPARYWDEFLLDAQAVLSLFYKEHIKRQHRRP